MVTKVAQAGIRKQGRWPIHLGWALAAMLLFASGVLLGMRWSGATLGTLESANRRHEGFGRLRIALEALDGNEPDGLRKGMSRLTYNAVMGFVGLSRFGDCTHTERELILRAKDRLDKDRPATSDGEKDLRGMAYAFCDGPPAKIGLP